MWVGMWLVVPQLYGARKRKSLYLSHPGTWLKVLWGQLGSLDQTFIISSCCFQTKQKNLIFFGFEDLLCIFFIKQEKNLKGHFFVLPWKLYSWLQTISPVLKPLTIFYSLFFLPPLFAFRGDWLHVALCYPREAVFQVVADIYQRRTGMVHSVKHYLAAPSWASALNGTDERLFYFDRASGWALHYSWVGSKPSGSFSFQPQHFLSLSSS